MKPFGQSRPAGFLCGLLVAATVVGAPTAGWAQDGSVQTFDIPAQDARRALVDLCLSAGCELAFIAPPGRTLQSHGVRGRMGWRAAVSEMLRDTPLRYRFVGARGLRVWVEPARVAPVVSAVVEPSELAPVEVVGRFAGQVEESLRRKRQADVISDSASAARIGELPAANLAEALQRVPGVAIEREVGEGQFVSVRGLGPLFQSVTLNGAPVAFNENIRNSTQSGRQFRFRALSAELLAGAQVTKSAAPDLIEGGIGSNIDIETISGLGGHAFFSLRAGGAVEDRARAIRPDVSIAGRMVSKDGDWGLVGGLAQEQRSVVYDRFQIQRYGDLMLDGRMVAAPNDVGATVEQEDRRRRSLFLGGDWEPSPTTRLSFNSLISNFDNAIREDRLVYGLGERLTAPGGMVTVRDGVVVAASVPAGRIDNNTEFSQQTHLNLIVSGKAQFDVSGWRTTARVSASRARSRLDAPLLRIHSQSIDKTAYAVDLRGAVTGRRAASLTTDMNLLDPAAVRNQRLAVRAIESVDNDLTLMLDAQRGLGRDVGPVRLSQVKFGAQISERSRDYKRRDRQAALRPGAAITPDFMGWQTPNYVFRGLIGRQPGGWASADFGRFRDAFYIPDEHDGIIVLPRDLMPTGADLRNSYAVSEQVGAVYVRLDFDGAAGAVPFFGNFGLRAVTTRTDVDGALVEKGGDGALAIQPVSHAGEATLLLPSANIAFDLDDHKRLRLAASRTMTRPSLADLRLATAPASMLVSNIYERGQAEIDDPSPGAIFSGIGGNPALKPYVSTNLDLSYEWSFTNGALSVAVFHKRIDDFIALVAAPEVLTFETRAGPLVQAQVSMLRPRNMGRAESRGVEVGLHRKLSSGFGLWASATLTDSRGPNGEMRLTGVSDLAYSINPFFERGPVSAGLSWSWRSAFKSEADMQGGGVSDFIIAPAGYLDAQASYDLMVGAQIVVAASNLTDTTDLAYEGGKSRLLQLGRVGRSLTVSLRWSM